MNIYDYGPYYFAIYMDLETADFDAKEHMIYIPKHEINSLDELMKRLPPYIDTWYIFVKEINNGDVVRRIFEYGKWRSYDNPVWNVNKL